MYTRLPNGARSVSERDYILQAIKCHQRQGNAYFVAGYLAALDDLDTEAAREVVRIHAIINSMVVLLMNVAQ